MKPAHPSSLLKTPLPVTTGCGPKVIRIQAALWGPLAASCEPRSPPLSIWGSLKGSRASGGHSHAHKCPRPKLLVRGLSSVVFGEPEGSAESCVDTLVLQGNMWLPVRN